MSKGSNPRNCFSVDFRNNYDDIDWTDKPKTVSSTIEGVIRQTTDTPLEPENCDCEDDQDNCCANE